MRTFSAACAALALIATPIICQVQPRPSIGPVDTTSTGFGILPSIASAGDLSAVAYTDGGSSGNDTINIVTSNGEALSWSAPVRIDSGPIGVTKLTQFDSCAIDGNTIWVVWEDDRSPTAGRFDLYINRSNDGGATFLGEQLLNKGYPAGTGSVRDWRFVQANPLDLYILVSVDPSGSADEELYLLSSHDGGATFGIALRVDSTPDDVDQISLAVDPIDPFVVHIAWTDDRAGSSTLDDVFYRRSIDGGATFVAVESQLDSSGASSGDAESNIRVCAEGPLVGIAWLEERASTSNEELRFALSVDAGASFAADVLIGGYTAGTHDIDTFDLALFAGTFYFAWDDNRTGSDRLYVTSAPGGSPIRTEVAADSGGDGNAPRFAGSGSLVGVAFTSDLGTPDGAEAAFTEDAGNTWTVEQPFTDQPGNDADFVEFAYNDLYRNFTSCWLANTGNPTGSNSTNRIYVGGFRPQTCAPQGWNDIYNPASNTLSFDFRHFGTNTFALVGLSAGTGPLPTGDGRLFGLRPSVAPLGSPGFQANLVAGSGSSIALPNIFAGGGPASGLTVFYAAAGFGGGGLGHLTDTFSFDI